MDHSIAHLMDYTTDAIETINIESKFTHQEKEKSLRKSESLMHHKEQHQQSTFYKELGEVIKQYDAVLLFGPTDAKVELFNILSKDFLFSKIKIEVKQADKMTENQQHAFVKDFFKKN